MTVDCVCAVTVRNFLCRQRTNSEQCRLILFLGLWLAVGMTTFTLFVHSPYSKRLPSWQTFAQTVLPRARTRLLRGQQDVFLCGIVRGRLGNALFSYMSMLGLARANNMTLLLKDESVLPEVLQSPPRTSPDFDEQCAGAWFVEQRRCCVFDERLVKLPHNDHYLLHGCLISWRYFQGMKEEVKSRVAFRRDVVSQAREIVEELRGKERRKGPGSGEVTLVGMHVRRGDQSGFLAYWHGHNPVTPEYIMRAMRYFTDRFQHVHFVVASQDSDWCRKHVSRNRNDVTIMEGNSAAVDMAVLTLTDHMIVSVGTFGWWAGYLNQGIKTYMKDFIGPRSIFSESFDDLNATDYIYPGWVGLQP